MSPFKRFIITLIIVLTAQLRSPQATAENRRDLIIDGLRIFREKELVRILNLEKYQSGSNTAPDAAETISNFYKKNGYTLVRVHIVEDSPERIALYVNEGRLGKIVVHGLNNYYSLKVKQLILFPGRIYNTEILEQNISRIKGKYRFADVETEVEQIADYSGTMFQIDRSLRKIAIIVNNIPIFSNFPPEYDLHFYPEKGSGMQGLSISRDGISFNIDYDYPSEIIPEVSWYRDNIFYGKDYIELEFSSGFDPGLKGFLSLHPENTLVFPPERSFSQLLSEYKLHPFKNDLFGPIFRGKFYQSDSSRRDLGIEEYTYLQSRFTLAPEFTFLKFFRIYAGSGCERVDFYEVGIDETAVKHYEQGEGNENYPFFESRIKLDPIPVRLGNRIDRNLILTFAEYFGSLSSRELQITSAYDFEFSNLSIYSFKFRTTLNYLNTPFYHNTGVNSSYFKGFSGSGYYTNREFSASNEYRFSVYQDYIYAGGFIDYTVFKPEGYLISGTKQGVAAGPTGRFLFYDQFELIVYYSLDRLFPDGISGTNLQLKLRKKW